MPEQLEGRGAQERDEQHGEVPGVRAVLRRLLHVPGSVVPFRDMTHAMAQAMAPGGGGMGRRIGHQVQDAEETVAQEQCSYQEQGQ